jgi:hypothetical protein
MPTPGARRQRHMRDAVDPDRRADPVDQIKQGVRPIDETIVDLLTEPSKFTLATTNRLPDTTNSGHLVLPEADSPLSQ